MCTRQSLFWWEALQLYRVKMTTHGSFAGLSGYSYLSWPPSQLFCKPTVLLANNNSGFQAHISHAGFVSGLETCGKHWPGWVCSLQIWQFRCYPAETEPSVEIDHPVTTLTLPVPTPGMSAWLTSITAYSCVFFTHTLATVETTIVGLGLD